MGRAEGHGGGQDEGEGGGDGGSLITRIVPRKKVRVRENVEKYWMVHHDYDEREKSVTINENGKDDWKEGEGEE